jgi:inhibitor of cysteine peptidase
MKVVHLADRDSDLALTQGETFEVRLPENATTGFQWSIAQLPEVVVLLEDDTAAPDGLQPGAAGEHRFRFVVRGAPSGRVVLELRRPWEQEIEPEEAFEVRIAPG